ncbi:phage major capsid protein [Roseomonas sp. OT10]|uniref:phage major capsid protein n=1 Tax=Roseomonas cutis TaxID=2897332 RepID=UPI001E4597D9|nr:phage major capsid protein [Roseomonas sp. OT10]UFN48904.1 phage major capsid protein [Roseomonas sp. OT10]
MTLREMLERRAAIAAEMRSLNTAPAGEAGDLSAEQRTRWDALKAELDALESRIGRQSIVDDAERRAAGTPVPGTGDARLDAEISRVGILDVIRASLGGTDPAAGRAREVSTELERRSGRRAEGLFWHMGAPANVESRVVTTALPAGGPGGNLVPGEYREDLFIDRLRTTTRVRALGATVLTGLLGNITIPRRKASVVAGWVAENTALAFSDPQFDGVTLTPKHAGVITEYSRNMIQQASPDVEQLARNDMALVLAETLDRAAIAGSGAGAEPRGILNTSGIGGVSAGTNGGALTFDLVADLQGQVEDANADGGSMGFLTNTRVRRAAAKMKDVSGFPLGVPMVFQGATPTVTNNVPSNLTKGTGTGLSALIYGNWSDLLIGVWSELDILVNPYAADAYAKGNVQIRAMMTVDVAVRHPESFAAIKDIIA